MELLSRGLEGPTVEALRASKVVLLEGARGVGKTALCGKLDALDLLEQVVDLGVPATRERAASSAETFVEDLPRPVAIDEAQLVDELTLAVKRAVDRDDRAGQFLLTGSSRIGRGALGGSDPLAGRSVRLRLRPFTQSERTGRPLEIVGELFEGDLEPRHLSTGSRVDLLRRMRVGGIPTLPGVIPGTTRPRHLDVVGEYVESVLHLALGDSRVDRAALIRTYRYLLALTGQILNRQKCASALGVRPETLGAYIERLEDSFLLERLPAFHPRAHVAARRHPKLIAPDTALAVWGIGDGSLDDDVAARGDGFGALLENLVLCELLGQATWATPRVQVSYWRDPKGRFEVDAVLSDSQGRAVALEVKAASTVSRDDQRGIEAFRRTFPEQFHRGFVFYTGAEFQRLQSSIWAVPVTALWELETEIAPPSGTALFVSYVRDDDRAEGGRIVQLARDLAERYRFLTGTDDLDLFLDKDIRWGEEWRTRLDGELRRATFFVAVVTPRFLRSEACREEVLTYLGVADATGNRDSFGSILYVDPGELSDSDPVERAIKNHQYEDWSDLRYEDTSSGAYRRAVDRLAQTLIRRDADETPTTSIARVSEGLKEAQPDLLEHLATFEQVSDELVEGVNELVAAMQGVASRFEDLGPRIDQAQRRGGVKAVQRALSEFAEEFRDPVRDLRAATDRVRDLENQVDEGVAAIIDLAAAAQEPSQLDELAGAVDGLLAAASIDEAEVGQVRDVLRLMAGTSRDLRAPAEAVDDAIVVITDFLALAARWRSAIDARR